MHFEVARIVLDKVLLILGIPSYDIIDNYKGLDVNIFVNSICYMNYYAICHFHNSQYRIKNNFVATVLHFVSVNNEILYETKTK